MKKLLLIATLSVVGVTSTVSAKIWYVTTSCGVQGSINIADNASADQIKQAVSQYNYNNCGVYASQITLTF
ncbi:hypothetical protein [Daejeonia sp. YH14]|uniref:hypothetical protein n=1 Tax=Daejeonia sp. YH14 TaxID=3439042 RepID=UPI003F494D76